MPCVVSNAYPGTRGSYLYFTVPENPNNLYLYFTDVNNNIQGGTIIVKRSQSQILKSQKNITYMKPNTHSSPT